MLAERYLQLTRKTWSIRRSIGATSSPGGLRAPVHSIRIGFRLREANEAATAAADEFLGNRLLPVLARREARDSEKDSALDPA